MSDGTMEVDDILEEVGQSGRYQLLFFFLLFLVDVQTSFFPISFVFTASELQYRCLIPECEDSLNATYDNARSLQYIPVIDGSPAKCVRYRQIEQIETDAVGCSVDNFSTNFTDRCNWTQLVFDSPRTSAANDFDLLCEENRWKLSGVGTANNIGQFAGYLVFGIISDKYGRKYSLIGALLLSTLFGILRSYATNFTWFLFFEFADAIVSTGIFAATYILAMEILGAEQRLLGGALLQCFYSVGQTLLGLAAWKTHSWRVFLRILYYPGIVFISYVWLVLLDGAVAQSVEQTFIFDPHGLSVIRNPKPGGPRVFPRKNGALIPESIRWLFVNKRIDEAIKALEKIGRINRKPLHPRTKHNLLILKAKVVEGKNHEEANKMLASTMSMGKEEEKHPIKTALKSKIILIRVIVCSFCWMTNIFVYAGLSLNSVFISGNQHLNFILTCLVEVPANLMIIPLLNRCGRRGSQLCSLFLSGVSLLAFPFIPSGMVALQLTLYLFGKIMITISFSVMYVYFSELFPTNARNTLMATCALFSRIGSISAPLTPLLKHYVDPVIVFAVFSLLGGLSALLLPETRYSGLPDTLLDAESIGKRNGVKTKQDCEE